MTSTAGERGKSPYSSISCAQKSHGPNVIEVTAKPDTDHWRLWFSYGLLTIAGRELTLGVSNHMCNRPALEPVSQSDWWHQTFASALPQRECKYLPRPLVGAVCFSDITDSNLTIIPSPTLVNARPDVDAHAQSDQHQAHEYSFQGFDGVSLSWWVDEIRFEHSRWKRSCRDILQRRGQHVQENHQRAVVKWREESGLIQTMCVTSIRYLSSREGSKLKIASAETAKRLGDTDGNCNWLIRSTFYSWFRGVDTATAASWSSDDPTNAGFGNAGGSQRSRHAACCVDTYGQMIRRLCRTNSADQSSSGRHVPWCSLLFLSDSRSMLSPRSGMGNGWLILQLLKTGPTGRTD